MYTSRNFKSQGVFTDSTQYHIPQGVNSARPKCVNRFSDSDDDNDYHIDILVPERK